MTVQNTFRAHAKGPQLHETYLVMDITSYSFAARVRGKEPTRTQLIVRNLGTVDLEVGYTTNNNDNYSQGAFPTLLPVGQEYVENLSNQGSLFVRPHTNGNIGRVGVYTKLGS